MEYIALGQNGNKKETIFNNVMKFEVLQKSREFFD
jgi:hypothetical protein